MAYSFRCEHVVPGCAGEVHGDTEHETLQAAVEHAASAHGLTDLDDETVEKVKAGITAD